MKKRLAEWFLRELPEGYPKDRLRTRQGFEEVRILLKKEDDREDMGNGLRSKAHPSGLIVRYVRRGIVWLCFTRPQVWIDSARDWMAFTILGRSGRTPEEIMTWRDHYFLFRSGYFIFVLIGFPYIHISTLKVLLLFLSGVWALEILGGMAGSALIWSSRSLSYERSFVTFLMAYADVIVAFAGYYRACDCLNVRNPDALQALYFSAVVASTVGLGDILPLNSTGIDARGNP